MQRVTGFWNSQKMFYLEFEKVGFEINTALILYL